MKPLGSNHLNHLWGVPPISLRGLTCAHAPTLATNAIHFPGIWIIASIAETSCRWRSHRPPRQGSAYFPRHFQEYGSCQFNAFALYALLPYCSLQALLTKIGLRSPALLSQTQSPAVFPINLALKPRPNCFAHQGVRFTPPSTTSLSPPVPGIVWLGTHGIALAQHL